MIGLTRFVAATAWVLSASFGCAGTTPRPSTPNYFRSPPLDYGEALRSASDGEVLGALQHPPDDWLRGGATTQHAAPGWSKHPGHVLAGHTHPSHFRFEPEHAHAGQGARLEAPACPPTNAPLAPDDAVQQAALLRSWLKTSRDPSLPVLATAVVEMPSQRPGFLSCNSR